MSLGPGTRLARGGRQHCPGYLEASFLSEESTPQGPLWKAWMAANVEIRPWMAANHCSNNAAISMNRQAPPAHRKVLHNLGLFQSSVEH